MLTVQTFLKIYEFSRRRAQYIFFTEPSEFFNVSWSRLHKPQIILVHAHLQQLNVSLREVCHSNNALTDLKIEFQDIFPNHAKLLPSRHLNNILEDQLNQLATDNIIATDASVCNEKEGRSGDLL